MFSQIHLSFNFAYWLFCLFFGKGIKPKYKLRKVDRESVNNNCTLTPPAIKWEWKEMESVLQVLYYSHSIIIFVSNKMLVLSAWMVKKYRKKHLRKTEIITIHGQQAAVTYSWASLSWVQMAEHSALCFSSRFSMITSALFAMVTTHFDITPIFSQ